MKTAVRSAKTVTSGAGTGAGYSMRCTSRSASNLLRARRSRQQTHKTDAAAKAAKQAMFTMTAVR